MWLTLRKAYYCIIAERSDQPVTSHLFWGFTPTSGGQPVCDAGPYCSLVTFADEHLCVCFLAVPHALEEPPSTHLPINSSFSSQALFKAALCLWWYQPVCLLSPTHAALLCLGSLCANMATDYAGQRSSPASRGHCLTVPICRLFS